MMHHLGELDGIKRASGVREASIARSAASLCIKSLNSSLASGQTVSSMLRLAPETAEKDQSRTDDATCLQVQRRSAGG